MNADRAVQLLVTNGQENKDGTLGFVSVAEMERARYLGVLAIEAMRHLGDDAIAQALPSSAAYNAYSAFFRELEGG